MSWIAYREVIIDEDTGDTTCHYYAGDGVWTPLSSMSEQFDTEQEALNVPDADGAEEV